MVSQKNGVRGKRRIVPPPSASIRPRTVQAPEPLPEPKPTELLQKARAQALAGLSELVAAAVGTLRGSLIEGAERRQGSRSSDARYVLDVVLDRIPAPAEAPEDAELDENGELAQTPVDELALRRIELQKLLRQQRKDMERNSRNNKP